jgi:hypothetical protein
VLNLPALDYLSVHCHWSPVPWWENHQQLTGDKNWDADVLENASGFLTPNTAHDLGVMVGSDLKQCHKRICGSCGEIPSSRPIPSLEARLPFAAILGGPAEPSLNSKFWQQLKLKNG